MARKAGSMTLHCKPGDLAIVVKSDAGNHGKIVRCIRLASLSEIRGWFFSDLFGPVWVIDQNLLSTNGNKVPLAIDSYLMPIRPSEGQDETLQWAPVPEKELA
jgi:hypothetical protein